MEPLLVLILGGPGSGKSSLGEAVQKEFPGLCAVSGGDLARLATSDAAQARSPLLYHIARQHGDRRRRKQAALRLNQVVTAATVLGLRSCQGAIGLVADGVRAADIEKFEQAHGANITCILWICCPRETLVQRQHLRGGREGDDRLGLKDTTDSEGRIEAYLGREKAEDDALQQHFGADKYKSVVHRVDGTAPREEVIQEALRALRLAVDASGIDRLKVLETASCTAGSEIDWLSALAQVQLEEGEVGPDGRPVADRRKPEQNTEKDAEKEQTRRSGRSRDRGRGRGGYNQSSWASTQKTGAN